MATITIEIPDDPSDIKGAIEALQRKLAPINAQRDALYAAIDSLRKRCPHKNAYHGTDIGGGPDGRCYDCGYSW
jgi:transposase-like protein